MKVALHNLGCKVNAYETEAMAELLKKAGYELVPFDEQADIYIINTCTVTNMADRKSRQMLHKAKKKNPKALVVAAGCYVQAVGEDALNIEGIDLIVGNDKKKQIVEIIQERQGAIEDINDTKIKRKFEELEIETMEEHTRAYMKIQDGCNQFCTYCIIPYARGRVRSRGIQEIEKEAERLVNSGYQEIVLTGIHLSSYGLDFQSTDGQSVDGQSGNSSFGDYQPENSTLLDVICRLGKNPKIKRIRLGSLEPRIITEEFLITLSKLDSFCPQFHLSLQSGCDETLKRMNRRYTTGEYLERCRLIRNYFPDAAITTDIIVGFPGETEEEFAKTMEFVKEVQFSKIHIFKYSKREGTKAAAMKDQIPEPIKTLRSNQLMEVEQALRMEYMDKLVGVQKEVLLEEVVELQETRYFVGHTKEYVKVAVTFSENLRENTMVSLRITERLNGEIMLAEK